MVVQFLRLERQPEEPLSTYNQRRYRAAAAIADQQGDWGTAHAKRICAWADHLRRPRNASSLAAMFFAWHPAEWLQARRDDPHIGGAARPGTREHSGPVPARWDESLAKALAACEAAR